ncbi:hypothetical protein K435DRAFT_669857 [Dendrothele bispora CBS 962.96]|uniref:Lipid droplet-associated perilipin protein n=1 Tax=Dendrothele bispora (strain CBS 962.96) TaxID=1314807 RepID=A0A4V4HF60_DENBC|nr:hypothetical protein K435DRAFT_669857 [Dendrothele bispora CBS 962.96]
MPSKADSSSPPELTVISRFASIPLIATSLDVVNETLSNNAYTRAPYSTAKGLSLSAYKITEPVQIQLAPILVRADGYANKAVDMVESRYPSAFTVTPDDLLSYVRETQRSYSDYVRERRASASKVIDEKVRTPAIHVAEGIDQRFAPIVDRLQIAVSRISSNTSSPAGSPSSENTSGRYQYQRVFALSKDLQDSLWIISNEQLKQLQSHSVLVQRASDTAQSISAITTSSITSAQASIHALSDNMLNELKHLQSQVVDISISLQNSASATIRDPSSQIPPQIQQKYTELSSSLHATATDLHKILVTKDMPLQEKVSRVGTQVRESVDPLLESLKQNLSDLLARGKTTAEQSAPKVNGVNGVH